MSVNTTHIMALNDDTLAALHKALSERNASQNGEAGEALGMALSEEWQRRHPGTLPPHLAGKPKPPCYRGPGASRPLNVIGQEIAKDWGAKPGGIYFGAKPYIEAMLGLGTLADHYGSDSAESVVRYFLANSARWRGDVAKRVKAELKAMLQK